MNILKSINPNNGEKYSPNLFKWMKRWANVAEYVSVFSDEEGVMLIGFDPEEGFFHASKLNDVLCNGTKANIIAYTMSSIGKLKKLDTFWEEYIKDGRCAIDRSHTVYFIGSQARWNNSKDRKSRECTWCNNCSQILHEWTERIEKSEWVANPDK